MKLEYKKEAINAQAPFDLIDKNTFLMDFLQEEVFGEIYMRKSSQEPYNDKSIIFDEPCAEFFTLEAKKQLENLGYEVAIFKDIEESNRINDDFYIFTYANNEVDLKEAFHYLNAKERYEFDNAKSTKDYLNSYYSYSNEVSDEQRTARLYRK